MIVFLERSQNSLGSIFGIRKLILSDIRGRLNFSSPNGRERKKERGGQITMDILRL